MTQAQYARYRGKSPQYLKLAIPVSANGDTGHSAVAFARSRWGSRIVHPQFPPGGSARNRGRLKTLAEVEERIKILLQL